MSFLNLFHCCINGRKKESAVIVQPHFMIIGSMKCGTNTIGRYIESHDECFLPPKVVSYFNNRPCSEGIRGYENNFALGAGKKAIGDRSPGYCSFPGAAKEFR